jgi:predicted TIM-barrel fold metal-dependent hydrolase
MILDGMPPKAVDCHAHIFPPEFPLPVGPGHKPEPYQCVTRHDHRTMLRKHGLTHGVLSQPSGYLFDNSAMLDAIAHGEGRIKGIANVPYDSDDASLDGLEQQGIVGQRFNLFDLDPTELAKPEALRFLDRLRERGWWVEIHALGPWYADLMPILSRGNKLILCHMGRPTIDLGLNEPGFQCALELGRSGLAVAKFTGIKRFSGQPMPHADADPFVAAVLEAFTPAHCIWGSDWPHLLHGPEMTYDYGLRWLEHAVPDHAIRNRMLWESPKALFGFAE